MTLTVTGADQEELAQTLEHEVLRLVKEDYRSGFDKNDTGSYTFSVEGWDQDDLSDPYGD